MKNKKEAALSESKTTAQNQPTTKHSVDGSRDLNTIDKLKFLNDVLRNLKAKIEYEED
ncbi:hypothetical protein HYY74_04530 [Candidatus Woesearchaeota archaeon]|nr:hypothetical protein [Candidatus Woesearchaeota archaeon]